MIIATYTNTATETAYTLEADETQNGTLYTITGKVMDGTQESIIDQRFFSIRSEAMAQFNKIPATFKTQPETITPETITYTTLNWQKVDGLAGEYTAPIDSTGFSMTISKTSKGYQVSTCEHDATDVMYYDELAYQVGNEWYTKTLRSAKKIAQDFLEVWNHNLAESPAN